MASIDFDPEDYLDEVSDDDLIEELKGRGRKIMDKNDAALDEDLDLALWLAQSGKKNEALLHLERALPQFKGLLYEVTP